MNSELAKKFVQSNGNLIEQAQLNFVLNDQPVPSSIIAEFFSSQHQNGSWNPFWAAHYSSLDATCFHLARAHELGISRSDPAIAKAFLFIADQLSASAIAKRFDVNTGSVYALIRDFKKPGRRKNQCSFFSPSNQDRSEIGLSHRSWITYSSSAPGAMPVSTFIRL